MRAALERRKKESASIKRKVKEEGEDPPRKLASAAAARDVLKRPAKSSYAKAKERAASACAAAHPKAKPKTPPPMPTKGKKTIYRGSYIYAATDRFRVIINPWETRSDKPFRWEGNKAACYKNVLKAIDEARK